MCCGWDGELEYTVVLECMDCFNESLSTMYTNASFLKSQNGLYNVFISTKNKCGETITVNASHMVDNDKGVPEYVHIFIVLNMRTYLYALTQLPLVSLPQAILPLQRVQGTFRFYLQ